MSEEVAERLSQVERLLQEQEQALHFVFATVQAMKRGDNENAVREEKERAPMRDEVWACANCSARLGLYNSERDEMRVRYKDFLVYVRPGVGGVLRVPCRRCGEDNILQDTRS